MAGVHPCSPGPIVSDAQRRVIRSLGFTEDVEKIDQAAQDSYSKLFHKPVSDVHLVALAAIFGWTVEEGGEARTATLLECF